MDGKDEEIKNSKLRKKALPNHSHDTLDTFTDKKIITGASTITNDSERKRIEEALKESEEKYHVVFDNVNDMIGLNLIRDDGLPGKFIDINEMGIKRLGYSHDEFLNMTPMDIVAQDKRSEIPKNALKLSEKGHAIFEIIHQAKDGKRIPVEVNNHLFELNGKKVALAISRDITKRKKADEEIKLASFYNRSLIEATLDPLVTIGPEGEIDDVNNATEIVTGYSRDELIGSDFSDYFTDHKRARKGYQQVFNEGFVKDYPLEIQHRDGHITSVLYNASVYRDESGDVVGVFAAARDITELKKAENDIIRAKEEWEKTFDAVPDLIAILDTNFRIVRANKAMANRLEVIPEEAVGLTCYNVVHGLTAPPSFCPFSKLLDDGSEHTAEVHEDRIGGDFIISVSPLHDVDGKLIGAVHVARDITERKKAEDEIIKSLYEKEVLLREIHHRVKNNLQIIASLLHLQEVTVSGEGVDVLKESEGRVKSMAMIHEKLYQSPTFNDINFKQYIEKLVDDILYTYGTPTGTIRTNMIIEEINLNIDTAIPLGLIINELVTNSVKYAFPQLEGTITLKLKSLHEQMELTIADNGIGLPKDLDLEKTETLGLKLVNSLVNQLDGKLKLNRNNGTEFKITFKELKYKKRT